MKCLWNAIRFPHMASQDRKTFAILSSWFAFQNLWDCYRNERKRAKQILFLSWLKRLIMAANLKESLILFFTKFNFFCNLKNEADMSGSICLGNRDSKLSLQRIEKISKFSNNWLYYILCPSIPRQIVEILRSI